MHDDSEEYSKILLVEDDEALASVIYRALTKQGHEVEICSRGDLAISRFEVQQFDVVILDVMLPGLDGIKICKAIRAKGVPVSIIMLTAKTEIDDRVMGLDAGADDYLNKPFALKELYARIRAVKRRDVRRKAEQLKRGNVLLDVETHTCEREGVSITLRPKEFAILEYLMINAGLVITKDKLLETIWGGAVELQSNIIEAQMLRLRSKVDKPFSIQLIETVRGIGYKFNA